MAIKYDIEALKKEYVGRVINWITVTDVFRDENNRTMCSYICKCGNSKVAPIKVIKSEKIKSCGCYRHSAEFSNYLSNWCKEHPEDIKNRSNKYKQWVESNRDKVEEQGRRLSKYLSDHPEILRSRSERMSELNRLANRDRARELRVDAYKEIFANNPILKDFIPEDDIQKLLSGDALCSNKIRVKCPICEKYALHNVRDIFNVRNHNFRQTRMCRECFSLWVTSSYEDKISDFISSFYNGTCIRNDRAVLNGKELDLYYPEKKIAIEFNGDYWHSNAYKDNKYHYNKLADCLNNGILLVTIFESNWLNNTDAIKSYLFDLFNNKTNSLSFIGDYYLNNNYPLPGTSVHDISYSDLSYSFMKYTVYTCGCSQISPIDLSFIEKTADDYNLDYFINSNRDLEIKDKNLCFHLADMFSGEVDAYDRWELYHNRGIRCVFVYPPDFKHSSKLNIYKNILLYHCGLTKRIHARNTVVRKCKSIEMKQFFDDNNIAGYRGSKFAYVLEDKITKEPYMCYLLGPAFFGRGNYDCEITRGACKLGIHVSGGASKLWKYIISDNPKVNSIVYYCDRRQYDQRSITHLMDSRLMKDIGHVYMLNGDKSFMNYWINDVYIDGKLWHSSGDFTNREPNRHRLILNEVNLGNCVTVYNPGSYTNIFVRSGFHLENMKIVHNA